MYKKEHIHLKENEVAILRRTEIALVRAMCGARLIEKKRTEDLMEMLGLKKTVIQMVKANRVRWYGHVLRGDDAHVLREAFEFEGKGKRKRGLPKKTWKMQFETRDKPGTKLDDQDSLSKFKKMKKSRKASVTRNKKRQQR